MFDMVASMSIDVTAPPISPPGVAQRAFAEALGTAALLATIVGSGIMGDRLSGGSAGLALLANSIATGAMLVVLILVLRPVSGAHMNPLVSVAGAASGTLPWRDVPAYVGAQVAGGVGGVLLAHGMFAAPWVSSSTKVRAGPAQLLSEVVATFGLMLVVVGVGKTRPAALPFAVGLYITAAYWFTASTSFANPVVTIARSLTDTFTGIRGADVTGFIAAQVVGAVLAVVAGKVLFPARDDAA